MSLSIGIVGLPNVGKSTLFKTITKKEIDCANYPFCTIDPNIGVVAVPDKRVDNLAEIAKSAKKIYTTIEFVDIAGLVKGANKGEGLGNKFLANIRNVDAIVYVLRCFKNDKIINPQGKIDILGDKETLDIEMILKDLETIEKRLETLQKELKQRKGDKNLAKEVLVLEKIKDLLKQGQFLSNYDWPEEELKILKNYQLLTSKQRIFILNGLKEEVEEELLKVFKKNEWPFLIIDIATELDAVDMDSSERVSLGLSPETELNELIKESYKLLDLITFFTTGLDETRAWTLKKGGLAPEAGGRIHTDFEKNFVKAEVVNCQDLIEAGGLSAAREKGLVRTEGKEYVIKDGDVIEIKANA